MPWQPMWEAPSRTSCCPGRTADCTWPRRSLPPATRPAGILAGIRLVLDGAGVDPGSVGRVAHATTLGTNVILERKRRRGRVRDDERFSEPADPRTQARVEEQRYDLFFNPPRRRCRRRTASRSPSGSWPTAPFACIWRMTRPNRWPRPSPSSSSGRGGVLLALLCQPGQRASHGRHPPRGFPGEITIVASSEDVARVAGVRAGHHHAHVGLRRAHHGRVSGRSVEPAWPRSASYRQGAGHGVERRGDVGRPGRRPRRVHHRVRPRRRRDRLQDDRPAHRDGRI